MPGDETKDRPEGVVTENDPDEIDSDIVGTA